MYCGYLSLLGLVLLNGCANLNSIYRPLDLGGQISAVAVDVKQRAIITGTATRTVISKNGEKTTTTFPVVCAEPSPDALSAYASSGGLTNVFKSAAQKGAEDQAQLALSMAESSAFVGLRTQSIQLLRDGLFADCLAYMNKGIDEAEFFELRRRNQSITLGLLAIEQLTGAVKANQASLDSSADSATGVDSEKQISALNEAKDKQNNSRAEREDGVNALKNANEAVSSQAKVVVELAKSSALSGTDAAAKKAAQDALMTAQDDLKTKQNIAASAKTESERLGRASKNADDVVLLAQKTLEEAQRRVRSASAASAQLTANGGPPAAVSADVSKAVVSIVRSVLRTSSGKESNCFYLLSQLPQISDDEQFDYYKAVFSNICTKTEQSELARGTKRPDESQTDTAEIASSSSTPSEAHPVSSEATRPATPQQPTSPTPPAKSLPKAQIQQFLKQMQ